MSLGPKITGCEVNYAACGASSHAVGYIHSDIDSLNFEVNKSNEKLRIFTCGEADRL